MTLAPLNPTPVRNIDTMIDVVARGDGAHDHDDVFVTTSIELLGDIDPSEPATLILPMASEAQQQPLLRYTEEPIKGKAVFEFDPVERSVYDEQVVKRLEALADGASKKEQKALATAIGRAAKSLSATVIEIKPGQRKLRLFYGVSADKVADREFEFSVIGPLPSFVIQPGGSIGVIATLPRATTVVSAEALTDPNNPGSAIARTDANSPTGPRWPGFGRTTPCSGSATATRPGPALVPTPGASAAVRRFVAEFPPPRKSLSPPLGQITAPRELVRPTLLDVRQLLRRLIVGAIERRNCQLSA